MKLVCLVPEKERVIGLHTAGATKAEFDSVVAIHLTHRQREVPDYACVDPSNYSET